MGYYDEDFYCEPSEFDIQIAEFKKSLVASVKEEFVSEMEHLRKENKELQVIKADFHNIKTDYQAKEQQLLREKQDLERTVRRERLSSLMKDFQVVMYRVDYENELLPKCDKCDANRKIHFTTPLGRQTYEECTCKITKRVYYPKEFICSEFRISNDKNKMLAWFKLNRSSRDEDDYASYDSSTFAKVVYHEDLKYEDIKQYDTFFKIKEECQGYCDYLNAIVDRDN